MLVFFPIIFCATHRQTQKIEGKQLNVSYFSVQVSGGRDCGPDSEVTDWKPRMARVTLVGILQVPAVLTAGKAGAAPG